MAYQNVPRQKSPRGIVILLIVLGASVPVCGILAAIAIPAFVTYLNRSKEIEATMMVDTLGYELERLFAENCALPPSLPPLGDLKWCCGGSSCDMDGDALAIWEAAGVNVVSGEKYFVYETEQLADGNYAVRGVADWSCMGPPNHTREMILVPDYEECVLRAQPAVTTNQFQ